MKKQDISRRNFLSGAASFGAAAGAAALLDPGLAAAQSVGVKPVDLPYLTIKEVKIYLTDVKDIHRLNSTAPGAETTGNPNPWPSTGMLGAQGESRRSATPAASGLLGLVRLVVY